MVRDFCGHGVGRLFHEPPNILHYGQPGEGLEIKPGMIFTVEPMIDLGRAHVKLLSDGWTAVTRDRSLSAQFRFRDQGAASLPDFELSWSWRCSGRCRGATPSRSPRRCSSVSAALPKCCRRVSWPNHFAVL